MDSTEQKITVETEMENTQKEKVILDNDRQLVTYANMCRVSANAEEVFIHFGVRQSDRPEIADGVARIYLSLPSFKRLLEIGEILVGKVEAGLDEKILTDPNDRLSTPEAAERIRKFDEKHQLSR